MIVPIDSNYRITSNTMSWNLEKRKISTSNARPDQWQPIKYYSSLPQALSGALERELRASPANGVEEAVEVVRELQEAFSELHDRFRDAIS